MFNAVKTETVDEEQHFLWKGFGERSTFQIRPSDLLAVFRRYQRTTSNAEDNPVIRNKVRRDVASHRESNKMEIIWAKRGVQVDSDGLRSAARKDTFDMSSLIESLPSKPVSLPRSKSKKTIRLSFKSNIRSRLRSKLLENERYNEGRGNTSEEINNLMKADGTSTASKSPASGIVPSDCNSLISEMKHRRENQRLMDSIWWRIYKDISDFKLEENAVKQNEKSEERMNSDMRENQQTSSSPSQSVETGNHSKFWSKFSDLTPEDKQERKNMEGHYSRAENSPLICGSPSTIQGVQPMQDISSLDSGLNSDAESIQEICASPFPDLIRDASGKCVFKWDSGVNSDAENSQQRCGSPLSRLYHNPYPFDSWNSERNWVPDFSVQIKTFPFKKTSQTEGNADQDGERRMQFAQDHRGRMKERKMKALNSLRHVEVSDQEIEEKYEGGNSSQEASKVSKVRNIDSQKKSKKRRKKKKKSIRGSKHPSPLNRVNYDLVSDD